MDEDEYWIVVDFVEFFDVFVYVLEDYCGCFEGDVLMYLE